MAFECFVFHEFGPQKTRKIFPFAVCKLKHSPMKAITVKEIKLISVKLHTKRLVLFRHLPVDEIIIGSQKEISLKDPNFFMYSSYNGIDLFHRMKARKGVLKEWKVV